MIKTGTAKLFRCGGSQAVRLPKEFRFEGKEVFISRDDLTGDVVLSIRPGTKAWNTFFELLRIVDATGDFMADRPLNMVPSERGVFDEKDASPPSARRS